MKVDARSEWNGMTSVDMKQYFILKVNGQNESVFTVFVMECDIDEGKTRE